MTERPGASIVQMNYVDGPSSPCAGIATYVLINASDLEPPGQVNQLELVNMHGDSVDELAITSDRSHHANELYNSSAFFPPAKFFYIKVILLPPQSGTILSHALSPNILSLSKNEQYV